MNHRPTYQSISIHPADENGAMEVWAEWENYLGEEAFDADGIIGWLYEVDSVWIWINEAGHPVHVFAGDAQYIKPKMALQTWLYSLSSNVIWATEART